MKLLERSDEILIRKCLLIFVSLILLVSCNNSKVDIDSKLENVLIHFDNQDLKRMKMFLTKFHNGKVDYLLAITPTIEGNYIIYDLISDGSNVNIKIDHSRDIYSGGENTESKSYSCKDASVRKEFDIEGVRSIFEINDCTGSETFDRAGILIFNNI